MSVVVLLADARKSTRVFEASRQQSFLATPEALAALPGLLNALVRGAGADAQVELNRFLAALAQPEPPAAEPPPASPISATCSPSPMDAPASTPPTLVLAEDYLLPLDLSLLGTLS
ncbi:MAG: hypothetical protein RL514_4295 [Verrucomicrobiota bacterium]|jgi:hypothetical protein